MFNLSVFIIGCVLGVLLCVWSVYCLDIGDKTMVRKQKKYMQFHKIQSLSKEQIDYIANADKSANEK